MPCCIRGLEFCNKGHRGTALFLVGSLWALGLVVSYPVSGRTGANQKLNQNEVYHEVNCKIFWQVNSHLKISAETSAMLDFHSCTWTKINVSAVFLLPLLVLPLVIACIQLFKLGKGQFVLWSYKEIKLVESQYVFSAPIKGWFCSPLDTRSFSSRGEEAGNRWRERDAGSWATSVLSCTELLSFHVFIDRWSYQAQFSSSMRWLWHLCLWRTN